MISLQEYEENGGDVVQRHEFGLGEGVKAEVLAQRDPAWLADYWKGECLVRP
ncbi:hypothetical protein PENSPDRAFT_739348 [Peniophora sp. CONT]|nr:hypothetical protein PENSPDRAFT_739348 [Peniophora sp. CONT]